MGRPITSSAAAALACASVSSFAPLARAEWDVRHDLEAGYQGSVLPKTEEISRNRVYASLAHKSVWSGEQSTSRVTFTASGRAWWDIESEAQIRALSLAYAGETVAATLGFQEIAWSETFGLPIADLVNPRDLRDPFFFEMDWMRKPVLCANLQYLGESFRAQAIATPVPRTDDLPERGSAFDPLPPELDTIRLVGTPRFPLDEAGRDAEYGGRLGYLFDFGLDASVFYYRHWNRIPTYELGVEGTELVLLPVRERLHAVGATFSKAFDAWVLRGDVVVHPREPWTAGDLGRHRRIRHIQSVAGADLTTEDDWTLGGQLHYDQRGTENLFWVSGRVRKGLFDGRLEPQVFVYEGVGNTDLWVQPRIDWNVVDPWTLSVRADLLWGDPQHRPGDLAAYGERHRVFVWTYYRF